MTRTIDENDLDNAMDLLRQEMSAFQDKVLKLVDMKLSSMITEKSTTLMQDMMQTLDHKQQKMMKTIEAKMNAGEQQIMAKVNKADDALNDRCDYLDGQLKKLRQDMNTELTNLKSYTDRNFADVRKVLANVEDKCMAELKQTKEKSEETIKQIGMVDSTLRNAVDDVNRTREYVTGRLDDIINYQDKLEKDLFACENVCARRIEWEMAEAKRLLLASRRIVLATNKGQPRQSFFSPPFSAAGVRNLQIELQIKFKPPTSNPRDLIHMGEILLYLWAPKGTHIWFRLYLNDKCRNFEGNYGSRVPIGGTFGDLDVPVHCKEDEFKLLIALEICESRVTQTHDIQPYNPQQNENEGVMCAGAMYFSRHVNHRLLDQVKQQVEIVRSRLLKRVEWKLDEASKLQNHFGCGEAMLSPFFAVAGIDKIRFQFFPSGYLDPELNPNIQRGLCSLFLHCPAGTTIQGVLSVNINGNVQKRTIDHTYHEAGSFGRTQFCRFDLSGQHPDDYVIIGLDINMASQELQSMNNAPEEHGILKMVRGIESNNQLSDVRVLPTLWSRTNIYGEKLPAEKPANPNEKAGSVNTRVPKGKDGKPKKGLLGMLTGGK